MKALVFGVCILAAVTAIVMQYLSTSHIGDTANGFQQNQIAQRDQFHTIPPNATFGGEEALVLPLDR